MTQVHSLMSKVIISNSSTGYSELAMIFEGLPSSPIMSHLSLSEQNSLDMILSNILISEKIVKHLTFRDMKAASLVNWGFCRMIRTTLRFLEQIVLVLPGDAEGVEEMLKNTSCPWRSDVIVDLGLSSKAFDFLPRVLKNAQSIGVTAKADTDFWTCTRRLKKILDCSPNKFSIDTFNLQVKRIQEFRKLGSGLLIRRLESLGILANLEHLQVVDCDQHASWLEHLYKRNPTVCTLESNMKCSPGKLEVFSVVTNARDAGLVELVTQILTKYCDSLKELRFYLNIWDIDDLQTAQFPCLQILVTVVALTDKKVFIDFLKRHESLEELDVRVRGQGVLDLDLVAAIGERSSQLRKLYIEATSFSEVCHKGAWKFLRSMTLLQDFRLTAADSASFEMEAIAVSLLPRDSLRKLSVRYLVDPPHGLSSEQPDLLDGFKSLRSLCLIRCVSVNDELMQGILRELRNLEELEISCNESLTVDGLTGENLKSGAGFSLSNLRKLRSMTVDYCMLLTATDILKAVSLKRLTFLEYLPSEPISTNFVVQLVLQNPTLATITVPLSFPETTRKTIKRILLEENHPLRDVVHKDVN